MLRMVRRKRNSNSPKEQNFTEMDIDHDSLSGNVKSEPSFKEEMGFTATDTILGINSFIPESDLVIGSSDLNPPEEQSNQNVTAVEFATTDSQPSEPIIAEDLINGADLNTNFDEDQQDPLALPVDDIGPEHYCKFHSSVLPQDSEETQHLRILPLDFLRSDDMNRPFDAADCEICPFCTKKFVNLTSLRSHLLTAISPPRKHPCPDCRKCYTVKTDLEIHQRHVHNDPALAATKKFQCPACPRRYFLRAHLNKHLDIHRRELSSCSYCHQQFTLPCELATHIRLSHLNNNSVSMKSHIDNLFECETCHSLFFDRSELVEHSSAHSNRTPADLKRSPFISFIDANSPGFSCEICQAQYVDRSELFEHMSTHALNYPESNHLEIQQLPLTANDRDLVSEICYAQFPNGKKRKVGTKRSSHWIPTSVGDDLICSSPISNNQRISKNLSQCRDNHNFMEYQECHSASHGSSASEISQVKDSYLDHLNSSVTTASPQVYPIDSWRCKFCPAKFSESSDFSEHLNSHSSQPNIKSYNCQFCPAEFSMRTNLMRHLCASHSRKQQLKTEDAVEIDLTSELGDSDVSNFIPCTGSSTYSSMNHNIQALRCTPAIWRQNFSAPDTQNNHKSTDTFSVASSNINFSSAAMNNFPEGLGLKLSLSVEAHSQLPKMVPASNSSTTPVDKTSCHTSLNAAFLPVQSDQVSRSTSHQIVSEHVYPKGQNNFSSISHIMSPDPATFRAPSDYTTDETLIPDSVQLTWLGDSLMTPPAGSKSIIGYSPVQNNPFLKASHSLNLHSSNQVAQKFSELSGRPNLYRCEYCLAKFFSSTELMKHLTDRHPDEYIDPIMFKPGTLIVRYG